MDLKTAKGHIRAWIRAHFSDQKCAEVLAFAQDGRMSYTDPCGCLMGVTKSSYLHQGDHICTSRHYDEACEFDAEGNAERGFKNLAYPDGQDEESADWGTDTLRLRRFIPILKAEIRRRDRAAMEAAALHPAARQEVG